MLGFFPTAFEDECFYSLCARYAQIVNYPSRERAIVELFNRRSLSLAIDLPSYLNIFVGKIGVKSGFSARRIIERHSLLSYYAPFLPRDRVKKLKQLMKSGPGDAIHNIAGIVAASVNRPDKLKYCPLCVSEEINSSGIVYWHRLHQLPGVLVCPKHFCFLENSKADLVKNYYKAYLFYPQEYVSIFNPKNLNLSDINHRILLSIAQDCEWLLKTNIKCLGYERLHKIYLSILKNKGLAATAGRIKSTSLRNLFRNCYNSEILDTLQCNFDDNRIYNWLSWIIPNLRTLKVHHPLRHLLLIRMLGHTPETFFSYSSEDVKNAASKNQTYFLKGPYPCLNLVCEDFKKLTIESYVIKPGVDRKKGFKTIYITCMCGFSYYRNGPDTTQEDIYRRDRVTNYGELWEKELTKLWMDERLSIKTISHLLDISYATIKSHALAIGLEFPRKGPGNRFVKTTPKIQKQYRKNYLVRKNKRQLLEAKRKRFRQKWLSAKEKNPHAERTELAEKIAPKLSYWLRKHDREWFYLNQPKARERAVSRKIDWKVRDKECEVEVKRIAAAIKARGGKPVRVTRRSISHEMSHPNWINQSNYLKKMTLTEKVLQEVTETRIYYNIRRIHWMVNCIKEDGSSFAFSSVGFQVDPSLWKDPKIKQAIEDGVEEIKKHRGII